VKYLVENNTSGLSEFWRRYSRNRAAKIGLILVVFFSLIAIIGPMIAPFGPYEVSRDMFNFISRKHLMGTDQLGRDIFSQVMHGTRTSLMIGFFAAITSTIVGTLVGSISGYSGGRVDDLLMRITEVFMIIPRFFLLLVLVALFGSSLINLIVVIGLLSWPGTARLVRAEFLTLKESQFIEAAKGLGASLSHIVFREILPNATPPIIVTGTLGVGSAIILEAGLSFLGLGAPDQISLGTILNNAQAFVTRAWHISFFPGLFIFLICLGLNMMGDGLNDALNPRLKEK
jgi:peptide/nickel transport system permease protein